MAHQRKVIRAAVVAALTTGVALAEGRVYSTQKLLYAMRKLPAVAVYCLAETSSLDRRPRELTRVCNVEIESIVEAGSSVDDAVDDIAEEIENAMNFDPYFGSQVAESELVATAIQSKEEGDREIGILNLTYKVTYFTDAFVAVADVDTDDLDRVEAKQSIGGTQADEDQEGDLFEVVP